MDYDKVNDSGERQEFESGAVRDTQHGKGRYDLISPIALEALAKHYENGAVKYGDSNWTKGIPLRRFLDSAIRHLIKYAEGDRSEDHIIACAWNCFSLKHTEEILFRGELPFKLAEGLFRCTDSDDAKTQDWWNVYDSNMDTVETNSVYRTGGSDVQSLREALRSALIKIDDLNDELRDVRSGKSR